MKDHWEKIYSEKSNHEVSWFQEIPETSLNLIKKQANKSSQIIDVGGGNSMLLKNLWDLNFHNITVLDISKNAIGRSRKYFDKEPQEIKWIESNILDFKPPQKYNLWHDRAVFHFLTKREDQKKYIKLLLDSLKENGVLILSTFSTEGPIKCSGLEISQYNISKQKELFGDYFDLLESFHEDHITPFNTKQNFLYSVWRKK